MSRLTDLLRQARKLDPQLGADLETEFSALTKRRTFGLVFEQHQPEAVELPGRPVRRGDKVRVLPPRGKTSPGDKRLWRMTRVEHADGHRVARLVELNTEDPESQTISVDDVAVVAEFQDRVYPGLVETGRVERGGDKPFHTVINAENFHALEMLTYTHRHAIDVIYIDPPYNTRDKDWKYNNDYVNADDIYRHSKWLAMMERRLKIARQLLDPDDSVLIVTIDEKEYLRLGLLLEQMFPEAKFQMISTVIAPQGSQRPGRFSRIEEYIFCGFFGSAKATPSGDAMIVTTDDAGNDNSAVDTTVTWDSLIRRGTDATRASREDMFYPIIMDRETRRVIEIGQPLGAGNPIPDNPQSSDDRIVKWPIRSDGSEGRWQLGRDTLDAVLKAGMARVGRSYAVTYLKGGLRKQIANGEIVRTGTDEFGYPIYGTKTASMSWPRTLWNKRSHNASVYGSTLLRSIIPGRKFPFPKSLYAVEDTLRFFVKDKPSVIVLDFFSGSGTTAHAIMRLNRQDGGCRQCISVTNNEVSAAEQAGLRRQGLRPGDPEWEKLGICDYITKPRITAAITGNTPQGEPIKGDYKFADEFPISEGFDENAAYFTMTYEAPLSVHHNRTFERIAPMLWLRAGSRGRIITSLCERGWDVADTYAVLENLDEAEAFIGAVKEANGVRLVLVITDDDSAFQMVCRELPETVVPVRLYESYLQNFEITMGRGI